MVRFFIVPLIVSLPVAVQAGILPTLVSSLWQTDNTTEVFIEKEVKHAQNVTLLSAPLSIDPQGSRGGGDIIITDNGALVPNGFPQKDEAYKRQTKNSGEISVYVVREGDSLSQIAELFDVTINTIYWANDIKDPSLIQPGDSLVILPIVGVRHVVKDGDTLSAIAEKYQSNMDEILSYNQLASADKISIGDVLIIPGEYVAAPPEVRYATINQNSNYNSANLKHPLPGSVRTQGIHGYNAVDLASGPGTPIRAAAAGRVVIAKTGGWNGGYGNYIVIKHNTGVQTLYAHNSRNIVATGQSVGGGQTIGYVGNTGRSTGAHLHFEVRGARNPF